MQPSPHMRIVDNSADNVAILVLERMLASSSETQLVVRTQPLANPSTSRSSTEICLLWCHSRETLNILVEQNAPSAMR